ncbi:MAG: ABC transporter ATP-binding protein [Planctomycetota bacterium]|nr:ABC transporter ATP-binding protein [Planctomycetota bacterium]MDA1113376.1 ABC transporter ATP-binding protein [Planctomycetota bacterium]
MIRTQDLFKSYAAQQVLRGVSLQVERGEIFGFVGPNGAGKTTFLKCLLGIAQPLSGKIHIGGVDVSKQPLAARKLCGYAPSETAMYDSLSVWNMVRFCLASYKQADYARAKQLLDLYQLPHKTRVRSLSHGMKRKLLLTQAIASGAPVLLLDEPMEGLDPEARRLFERQLQGEAAAGRTVFFSSHDLASVERVCERVAFLRSGKLLACDRVENILEQAGHTLRVHLREPRALNTMPKAPGITWSGKDALWKMYFDGPMENAMALLQDLPIAGLRDASGGLEEVFEALYGPELEA